jgi:NAD(P)-dependent dehydrogenase (short-subunit alcohol dehydrogenase family)
VQLAVDTFGRLDVLVNNAGYGLIAPFKQISAEAFQAVVDTCFYGVVYATRAAITVMRKQKSGHIFQVSSIGGRLAYGGNTPYHITRPAPTDSTRRAGSARMLRVGATPTARPAAPHPHERCDDARNAGSGRQPRRRSARRRSTIRTARRLAPPNC